MKLKLAWKLIVPATVFSLAVVVPGFAQSNPSASDSMSSAGSSMKQAGSDTVDAAKHVYTGTATALHDTEITTKIKTALHQDSAIVHSDIHVATTAGVVTLKGQVLSSAVASRAEQLALATDGVLKVDDKMVVGPEAASN